MRSLNYVPENSMESLSVSESISKRWTTLKTEVVGGPSNSRELEQHMHYAFLSVAVVALLRLKCVMFYRGSEQQTTIFFSFFFFKLKTSSLE